MITPEEVKRRKEAATQAKRIEELEKELADM